MKSLTLLWKDVAIELATLCRTSATLDCKTVERRSEHEGVTFLTITLTNFGRDFEKSLAQGFIEINPSGKFKQRNGAPVFLRGFLSLVFDFKSGHLLDEPNIDAIFAIRQLTLMFGKIDLPIHQERVDRAIEGFFECENQMKELDRSWGEKYDILSSFDRINTLLSADAFASVDRKIYEGSIIPKHGPGATADRILGNEKYDIREWTERLERVFPYGEYALPNWRFFDHPEKDVPDSSNRVIWREPGNEEPVRVIHVPKTMKTPRVIAIEPVCMQYMQQGISIALTEEVHEDSVLKHFIRFTDQEPNQLMAQQSSMDQSLATLDLSEASDRVSYELVRLMFKNHPNLAEGVDACRSRTADVFGIRKIRLSKFASMGSALTFPIESIVFLTIIFVAIQSELNKPLTRNDIKSFAGRVRVYGDDIVVPIEYVHSVIAHLEAFGFKVNTDKSFFTGKFRESCGKEYYDGHDVSITRVRRKLPRSQSDVSEVVSLVALRNQFYMNGLWGVAKKLDKKIYNLLRGVYPPVSPTSSLLGRHTVLPHRTVRRLNAVHTPVIKGYVITSSTPENGVDGVPALLKYFLKRGSQPLNKRHLERSGRPLSVDIKQRYRPAW